MNRKNRRSGRGSLAGRATKRRLVSVFTEGLNVDFGSVHAIRDVSLSVSTGQILSIIGPPGSGKSTLLQAIAGAIPYRGRVGHQTPITGEKVWVPLGRHGIRSLQIPTLPRDTTVRSLLHAAGSTDETAAASAWRGSVRTVNEFAPEVASLLEGTRLLGKLAHMSHQLSYGERKILGLALAMQGHPLVLLADEPFSGIDDSNVSIVAAALKTFVRDGRVALVADHNYEALAQISSLTIVLSHGTIIAKAMLPDVLCKPSVIEAFA